MVAPQSRPFALFVLRVRHCCDADGLGVPFQGGDLCGCSVSGNLSRDHHCDNERRRCEGAEDRVTALAGGDQRFDRFYRRDVGQRRAVPTGHGFFSAEVMAMALQKVFRSIALGAACAALLLLGARRLARQIDQQHLLIVGMIVLGVGVAIALDLSVLFPMLVFGYLTRLLDQENRVLAIRIASDARVFLVITFVLAGAALDISLLRDYWLGAVTIILARFSSHFVAMRFLAMRCASQGRPLAVPSSDYSRCRVLPSSFCRVLSRFMGRWMSTSPTC